MISASFVLLSAICASGPLAGFCDPIAQEQRPAVKAEARQAPETAAAEPAKAGAGTPAESSPDAQESWFPELMNPEYLPSRFNLSLNGGLGLIRAISPYSLPEGEFVVSAGFDNYDRNPGDVDVVHYPLQAAIGLPGRTEFFFKVSPISRTNSVGQHPVEFPVPPLDLFVDLYPNDAQRPEPYFLFAQEFPYKTYSVPDVVIDPPGNGAFATSTGDVVLGLKVNLTGEERGHWAGLGVRGYWEIPTETPQFNSDGWRELTGVSGESNLGVDLLFSKAVGRTEILFNMGYKRVGDPSRGLRVQFVDSSKEDPEEFIVGEPVEVGLDLRDQLFLNAGVSLRIFNIGVYPVYFMGEFSNLSYVGGGTAVERKVHPNEMRLGLQFNPIRSVSLGFIWQLLFNDAGDGGTRLSNLLTPDGNRGDINFGELVDPELSEEVQEYLLRHGATFSYNSSKVFSTDNPAFDDWRNISTAPQRIIGQGGGNLLFMVTWRIAELW